MQVISQDASVRYVSESYLDVSSVLFHTNCTRPTPLQSHDLLDDSTADMRGPWTHGVVPIPVHVHPHDRIENDTR